MVAQGGGNKAEAGVEGFGLGVDGMGQDRSDASLFSDDQGSADGILEHSYTDSAPLIVLADSQACEEHDWNGVVSHAGSDTVWRIQGVDLADGKAEVARDAIFCADDECLC